MSWISPSSTTNHTGSTRWLAGWLAPTLLEDLLYSAAPLTFQHAARRQRKYKDTSSPTVFIACRSIWLTCQELGSWLTSACCSKCVERRPPNWSLLRILYIRATGFCILQWPWRSYVTDNSTVVQMKMVYYFRNKAIYSRQIIYSPYTSSFTHTRLKSSGLQPSWQRVIVVVDLPKYRLVGSRQLLMDFLKGLSDSMTLPDRSTSLHTFNGWLYIWLINYVKCHLWSNIYQITDAQTKSTVNATYIWSNATPLFHFIYRVLSTNTGQQ